MCGGVLYDLNDLLFFLTILVHSQGPSEQKPIKNYVKKERGHIHGLLNFFVVPVPPLLSQERVKLQTSNLAGTFTWSIGTKAR